MYNLFNWVMVECISVILIGFDSKGCLELNGKVRLTKKWIGTTEAASVYRMLNIKWVWLLWTITVNPL